MLGRRGALSAAAFGHGRCLAPEHDGIRLFGACRRYCLVPGPFRFAPDVCVGTRAARVGPGGPARVALGRAGLRFAGQVPGANVPC